MLPLKYRCLTGFHKENLNMSDEKKDKLDLIALLYLI